MKLNSVILISLGILCINATRCSNPEGNNQVGVFGDDKLKLTPEWTNDMRVTYSTSAGMVDVYTRYEIYTDSASYTFHEDQVTNKYKLKFSKTELDAIAKILYDNNFSRLSPTEHAIIYDKGSKSISVFKGAEGITKGDGATQSYKGKDGEALSRIQTEVMTIVQKKLNQQQKAQLRIVFDASLSETKYNYRLQFAPTDNYFDTGSEGRLKETGFELLNGKYNLSVYTYRSVPNYGTKYGPNGNILFSTLEVNTISIGLTKDSLISITPSKK